MLVVVLENTNHYKLNLNQSILEGRGFNFVQMKAHALSLEGTIAHNVLGDALAQIRKYMNM